MEFIELLRARKFSRVETAYVCKHIECHFETSGSGPRHELKVFFPDLKVEAGTILQLIHLVSK